MTIKISIEDRFLIEELVARYSFAWDNADSEAFASLFIEDAKCRFYINGASEPESTLVGKEALRGAVGVRAKYFQKIGLITKHFMPNTVVTSVVSPVAVTIRTQALITWQLKNVDLAPRTVQAGYYDSNLVKTGLDWQFASRDVFLSGKFGVKEIYPAKNS